MPRQRKPIMRVTETGDIVNSAGMEAMVITRDNVWKCMPERTGRTPPRASALPAKLLHGLYERVRCDMVPDLVGDHLVSLRR
jgi:hypothetical protein